MFHNLTRDETAARSAILTTDRYRITVDLTDTDRAETDQTFVTTTVAEFAAAEAVDTHIDLIADRVEAAELNGEPLDPAGFDGSRLPLRTRAGRNELTVTSRMRYSRSGEGLHRFVDPADGRHYLYTQFESAEARRVYACFDQPDLKARFEFTVLAPKHWTVIGNAPTPEPRSVAGTPYARWDFPPTEPISSYLTGFVAGEYVTVSDTHRVGSGQLPMSILVRASLAQYLDPERIFATTKAGFDVFERAFGYPYPFGKYDQAFVPEYNAGAMENVGCVTFRDDLVFRSRVTEASYTDRDSTILHELAHMWFGDLVTMVWWDDLWLKESFAEWASTFALAEISGDSDAAWAGFTGSRKNWAYRQDQLPSTHPIAADMVDLEAVESNFDGITYAKGASVLQQLVAFVGRDAFLAGARAYFTEHAFGNTRLSDLLKALQEPSGRDLSGWSAEWLETAGVNTLRPRFAVDADGRFTSFAVEQSAAEAYPTLRRHRLAIGLYDSATDGSLMRTGRVEADIAGGRTEIAELVGRPQPELLLLNDDDLSYAKIRFDPDSLRTLQTRLSELTSPLARALCWSAAWDMCRDAELPAEDYARLVLGNVGAESDLSTVRAVLTNARLAVGCYTAPAARAAIADRWETGLADAVGAAEPGSDHQLALVRAYAAAVRSTEGGRRLAGWLDGVRVPDGLLVDTELRWLLVGELARLGMAEDADIDAELARDDTVSGAEQAAAARAARPTSEAKARAWELAVETNTIANETQRQICLAFWQPEQQTALAGYREKYLRAAEQISASSGVWADKSTFFRQSVLNYLFPDIADDGVAITAVADWLQAGRSGERASLSEMVVRTVSERLDGARRAHRCQQAVS